MAELTIKYQYHTLTELEESHRSLVASAVKAMQDAHAPYSRFLVGAAVLLTDGRVISGNNQENAAYPSGLCAERVALFSAKSNHSASIAALAIAAQNEAGKPADAFACGACRQVMLEYATKPEQESPYKVIMRDRHDKYVVMEDARHLLPFTFDSDTLK